jgi:hypothetical protein
LSVSGRHVVDTNGKPVFLRGVNIFGMEIIPPSPGATYADAAGITAQLFESMASWRANVVRLAINRDWVLHGHDQAGDLAYLADLDRVIEQGAAHSMYTILSLRRLDEATAFGTRAGVDGVPVANFIAPQPDYDSIGMWRLLGERYADEPAVLFDLYAAPHAALPDDLSGYDTDWDMWSVWVRLMVAELRRMHPWSLCLVSGLNWGADLSGFPVRGTRGEPIANLVYAARVMEGEAAPWNGLAAVARDYPVFVTEWVGAENRSLWAEAVAMRLNACGYSWAASDWKTLRVSSSSVSRMGAVVRRALALGMVRS